MDTKPNSSPCEKTDSSLRLQVNTSDERLILEDEGRPSYDELIVVQDYKTIRVRLLSLAYFTMFLLAVIMLAGCVHLCVTLCLTFLSRPVCSSYNCLRQSTEIMKTLNVNIQPCSDFLHFVCGRTHPLQDFSGSTRPSFQQISRSYFERVLAEASNYSLNPVRSKLQLFAQTCSNSNYIEETSAVIRNLIGKLGGWRIITGQTNTEKNLISKIKQTTGLDVFFTVREYERVVFIEPLLKFNFSEKLANNQEAKRRKEKVLTILQAVSKGARLRNIACTDCSVEKATENIIAFEKRLAVRILENTPLSEKMESVNLDIVRNFTQSKDKEMYLSLLDEGLIDENKTFYIFKRQLEEINSLLEETEASILIDYVFWRLAEYFIPIGSVTYQELNGNTTNFKMLPNDQTKTCSSLLNRFMFPALQNFILSDNFDVGSFELTINFYKQIRDQLIHVANWMKPKTQEEFVELIDGLTQRIESYQRFNNRTWLKTQYKNLSVKNQSFSENLEAIISFTMDSKQKNHKSSYFDSEKGYDYNRNILHLSSSGLQPPLFVGTSDIYNIDYINTASLGSLVASDLIEYFITQAELKHQPRDALWKDDGNGWRPHHTECLNQTIHEYSKTSKGDQPDNLGDLLKYLEAEHVSLHLSRANYLKTVDKDGFASELAGLNYTPDQLFYISYYRSRCHIWNDKDWLRSRAAINSTLFSKLMNDLVFGQKHFLEVFQCDAADMPGKSCSL